MNRFQMLQPLLAVGLCVGLQTAAFAQAEDGPRTEVVSYSDLDLTHAAGQRILSARIDAAANRVCGPAPDRFSFSLSKDYGLCKQRAHRQALQTVALKGQTKSGVELAENTPRP